MKIISTIITLVFGLGFIVGGYLQLTPPISYIAMLVGLVMVVRASMEIYAAYKSPAREEAKGD